MKKNNIICIFLIILSLGVLFAYSAWNKLSLDSVSPEIRFPEQITQLSVTQDRKQLLAGITAVDKVDGDVTNSLVVEDIKIADPEKGSAMISVAAFDSSGNVAKAQTQVQYSDYHSPRFKLSRALIFQANLNVDVLNYISADDCIDGDLTHNIRAVSISEGSITDEGIHHVAFKVTNSLGDQAEIILPVETRTYSAGYGELTLSDYLIYLQKGDAFQPSDYLHSFKLNQETTSLEHGLPRNYTLETTGTVNTDKPGVYSVSYTVNYRIPSVNGSGSDQVIPAHSKLIVVVEG